MNQNEREGQSTGRTTGQSGIDAESEQNRTIEGQESDPGRVWQDSEKGQGRGQGQGQYTGQGDTSTGVGGSGGQPDSRGGYNDTRGSSSEDVSEEVNQQMDESQWQGSRFSQGGSTGNNQGGSNG